jgi:hypothetical protein
MEEMLFGEKGKEEISVLALDGVLEGVVKVFKLLSDQ